MPLETENPNPVYQLGRVAACCETYRHKVKDTTIDMCLSRPSAGLGLLMQQAHELSGSQQERISDVMTKIDVSTFPDGPLEVELQGPFWLGYYHQRGAMQLSESMTAQDPH